MSKLDGNERWGTKMMLTEHKEQYDRRHEPKYVGRATAEELVWIRDAIMYPHMLTIAERAHQDALRSNNPFRQHFAALTQIIMDRITRELNLVRRQLRERKIRIDKDEMQDGVIFHRYWCRGYEDRFGIVRETLASEIRIRLGKYGEEIVKQLRGAQKNEK